ncbi:gag-pol polyprotein [Tanacetum coccineum]
MSYLLSQFISLNLSSSKSIVTTNGDSMPLEGIGLLDTPSIALSNVYYIPSLTINLASVSKISDSGYDVKSSVFDCSIYDWKTHEVLGHVTCKGIFMFFDHFRDIHDTASSSVDLSSFWLNHSSSPFYLWHSRLGHVSGSRLRFFASTGALEKLDAHDISDCSGCKLAKFSALPFDNSVSSSNAPFDLVHSDVWGPSPIYTKGGSRYYVSFIDDFTRYTWVYLMKRRWTIYQTSYTDTPQQNRHHVETARSFLLAADVPNVFWGEAILTATYVINRIPTAHNSGLSPFEKLYGTLPGYSSLRVMVLVKRDIVVMIYSHNLTQYELIKLNQFDDFSEEHTPVVSHIIPEPVSEATIETTTTETPLASNTPPQTTTNTETQPITILEATLIVTQPPLTATHSSEVAAVLPPNVRPTHIRKSTKRDDFVYYSYSSSFASFIAYVHGLYESVSYMKVVCDPLWQGNMAGNLTALYQALVGSKILKPCMMGPLNNIKLDLLLKVTLKSIAWIMK